MFVIFRNNFGGKAESLLLIENTETDHLFLRPNKLCIVKAVDHIQGSHPNLKTVWGQNVSVGYGECKLREGSLLMVRLSSTVGKKR